MHKKFRKIYLEITNCCNLQCSFCPGTTREGKMMEEEEFASLMPKLRPWTDYLYFHLMGEPLMHPKLDRFLAIAGEYGFRVILTTNGTLLEKRQEILLNAPALHKVNISLHSFEANDAGVSMEHYLNACFSYGIAASGKKITVYRLWNRGGIDSQNSKILKRMKLSFPEEWIEQPRGTCLADKVFLEYGDKFDWPSLNAEESSGKSFCYGLRDQIGILCDGTVVPCCLDSDGNIPLGNLHNTDLNEIIYSQKAMEIYHGFSHGKAAQDLCRRCGYARRFH
jgi:radical SAM protein with 4Fe4S-binding SPASM domain